MSCVHLKKLYDLCAKEDIKIGASDLVRIVCKQCGEQESCPTLLMDPIEDDSEVEDKSARSSS
ncbi:MAG: hypothetical protein WBD31_16930 [Rubripirellula sp.]